MYLLWSILSANIIYIILVSPTTARSYPKITKLEIESNIRFRLATTTIRFEVSNTKNESKLSYFEVLLPNDALVFDVNLIVNGTLFVGRTIEKKKSPDYKVWLKKMKRKAQKLLKAQTFFDKNVFMMNATLAGKSEAFFNLTYKTLLLRNQNLYTHQIPIFLRQNLFVQQMHVSVTLWEPRNFLRFSASLIQEKNTPDIANDTDFDAPIRTFWRRRNDILVDYTGRLGKLRSVFSRVFRVQYDLKQPVNHYGDFLWHEGRGLYFFSSTIKQPLPMDVIFTIDMTTSMEMKWLAAVRQALPTILGKMQLTDRFNIIMYNRSQYEWKRELQYVNKENIKSAMKFVNSFSTLGISNIDGALKESVGHLENLSCGRFQAVYFLSDGYQAADWMPRKAVIKNVRDINRVRNIPIFTLGLGEISDVKLLRAVASTTSGKFKEIHERQVANATELMVGFFDEINARLFSNLAVTSCNHQAHRFDKSSNYYRGSEKIFYISIDCLNNYPELTINVTGCGYNGTFHYTLPLDEDDIGLRDDPQREDFLRSYLDFLTIRQAITLNDRKTIRAYKGLVLTYWTFITVIRKSSSNSNEQLPFSHEIWTQAISGSGVGDPHFMVTLKGLKRPVCFDMMGKPGDVINLLYDKRNGILVNAKIISSGGDGGGGGEEEEEEEEDDDEDEEDEDSEKTYLGVIGVSSKTENWTITPKGVQVSRQYSWQGESGPLGDQLVTGQYTDNRSMAITWKANEKKRVKLLIRRSQTKKESQTEYLDFFLVDGSGLSDATGGLIGQFNDRHGVVFKLRRTADGKMKSDIRLHYKNKSRTFSAVLTGNRRSVNLRQECWMVWKEGKGLVRGKYQDYVTNGLFETPILQHLQSPKT